MDTVRIGQLELHHHLPRGREREAARLDRAVLGALDTQVERALERAGLPVGEELCVRELNVPLQTTMGRHVNDDMFSFYMYTPSGFAIEYGAGGKQIEDWSKMKVFETTRGSHWGHQFVQPPPGAGA